VIAGAHVVMVSWRDPAHPRAGGAERYTAQVAEALRDAGARVTWLAPLVDGRDASERHEGIAIERRGRGVLQVPAAAAFLRRRRGTIDLVIDQANGYPMFTQLGHRGPRLLLIHQLAREIWFLHAPWPLAVVGYALEPWLLRPYRDTTTITVSASTRADLERWGFRDVRVVPNAVSAPEPALPRDPPWPPHFVGIGRLVRSKRFDHLLLAFEEVRAALPEARLTLIGDGRGPYADALVARIAATPGAQFERGASEARKWRVLAEGTALVATSMREGWGIVVSEAHAAGTPSIAYDVPGLRDSTRDGVDGLTCPPRSSAAARAMLRLASDPGLWRRCHEGALAAAAEQTPTRQREALLAVVGEALSGRASSGLPLDRP
jgi:glycosyltransferase involved in cell wall biosynthesis